MKRAPLTAAQQNRVVEMREAGELISVIARTVGCSLGSVQYFCRVHGAVPPKPHQPRPTPVTVRNGRIVRPFTAEDDAVMLELRQAGMRLSDIARRLGRAHNSIGDRLMTLAIREEMAA